MKIVAGPDHVYFSFSGRFLHSTVKKNFAFALKGQCHEMVVEVRPWSGRLGLN
jgi:hypothetical protein